MAAFYAFKRKIAVVRWSREAQLKCQALKQTNTDNKEEDNVLKLGSQGSPINLELTRQLLHVQ